jgi:chromosome segregation ATPase
MSSYYMHSPTPAIDENIAPTGTARSSDDKVLALMTVNLNTLESSESKKATIKLLEIESPGGTTRTVKNQDVHVVEDFKGVAMARFEALEDAVRGLVNGKKDSDKRIEDSDKRIEDSDKRIEVLDKRIEVLDKRIEVLETYKASSHERIKDLKNCKKELVKAHNDSLKEVAALKNQVGELENYIFFGPVLESEIMFP